MKTRVHLQVAMAMLAGATVLQAQVPTNRTAVTPGHMNYQGRLTTSAGVSYTNSTYGIEFRLWDASVGGASPLWAAKYLVYAKDGYFNVVLGSPAGMAVTTNTPLYGPQELWKALWFDSSESGTTVNARFLGITVLQDSDGVNLPADQISEAFPRQALLCSPFAERAQMAQYARQSINEFHVPGALTVVGNVVASNTLSVTGTTQLSGATTVTPLLTCNNGITVNNVVADLNHGLDVSGGVSYLRSGVEVTGSTALNGSATVTGDLNVPSGNIAASGNVTLGGSLSAPGGLENLRIIRGNVNGNGTVAQGGGFSATRLGTGSYKVTFSNAFTALPSVAVSAGDPATDDDNFADVNFLKVNEFRVNTWDGGESSNTPEDSWFSFIAIGPR